jgi:hypothetical protein
VSVSLGPHRSETRKEARSALAGCPSVARRESGAGVSFPNAPERASHQTCGARLIGRGPAALPWLVMFASACGGRCVGSNCNDGRTPRGRCEAESAAAERGGSVAHALVLRVYLPRAAVSARCATHSRYRRCRRAPTGPHSPDRQPGRPLGARHQRRLLVSGRQIRGAKPFGRGGSGRRRERDLRSTLSCAQPAVHSVRVAMRETGALNCARWAGCAFIAARLTCCGRRDFGAHDGGSLGRLRVRRESFVACA